MKRMLFYTLLLFFLPHNPVMSQEKNITPVMLEEIGSKTLRPFFNALKTGNVELIKRYISGKMYEDSQVLLNENQQYPEFLREQYKDAVFSVERGVSTEKGFIVDVSIEFPGGGKRVSQFVLHEQGQESQSRQQTVGGGRWRITEQQNNRVR